MLPNKICESPRSAIETGLIIDYIDSKLQWLLADPGLPTLNPTKSFWQSPPKIKLDSRPPKLPESRDVVIIGSGITGCSVAQWLLRENDKISITVLDARGVCSGATGRNGGHIRCVPVQDYDRLSRKFGHDAAVKIVRFALSHFESIVSTAKELGEKIFEDAELREVESVSAIMDEKKMDEIRSMVERFNYAFSDLRGMWRVCEEEEANRVYGIVSASGALVGKAGAAWPYRLIIGIFNALLMRYEDRFSIAAYTPATKIQRVPSHEYPYIVRTNRGSIRTKHVVHCTEGHAGHLLPRLRGLIFPRRGQMTVQSPSPDYPGLDGQRSWSFYFREGFDYLSQNPRTGDIFFGGGDIGKEQYFSQLGEASDDHESMAARSHLVSILPSVLKKDTGVAKLGSEGLKVKSSWSGIMCTPLDGIPLVGRLPQDALDRPDGREFGAEWISVGYNGYGMVNAWLCGRATAEMILGRDSSSWFPEQYLITASRIKDLNALLELSIRSSETFRSVL